jgi:hypothetical protein
VYYQLKAFRQQRLKHDLYRCRRRRGRRPRGQIETVPLQPARSTQDAVGVDIVCGPDQIQHARLPQFIPSVAKEPPCILGFLTGALTWTSAISNVCAVEGGCPNAVEDRRPISPIRANTRTGHQLICVIEDCIAADYATARPALRPSPRCIFWRFGGRQANRVVHEPNNTWRFLRSMGSAHSDDAVLSGKERNPETRQEERGRHDE